MELNLLEIIYNSLIIVSPALTLARSLIILNIRFKYYDGKQHCVKSVHIRNFSGLYFPAFGLNTESIPNTDTFHAAQKQKLFCCLYWDHDHMYHNLQIWSQIKLKYL